MKKKLLYLYHIMFMLICPVLLGSQATYAGVNDFYFSDFTGDYYLTKDSDNVSHLKVIESVTAEFPTFNQNKGICRQIAYTNQAGKNITLPSLTRSNLKVTRNGTNEPIYSIEKGDGYYDVCTGTDDYVLGTQVYTFEYEFEKVITQFDGYQELYWDTNGTGASQRFDRVTARVHFADPNWWSGESWCYVGKYGAKGSERCTITKLDDGVEFTTQNLTAHENLSFDTELKDGSFAIPKPPKNYIYIWVILALGAFCLLITGFKLKKFLSTREKARFYKDLFVTPEYQPHRSFTLPEVAEIYLGKKKDFKVAMLLELVVTHKIAFQKTDKNKWNIIVKDLSDVTPEYLDLLAILNGGTKPTVSDNIELKSRTATSRLIALKKSMETTILNNVKRDKLVEDKYRFGSSKGHGASNVILLSVILIPVMVMVGIVALKTIFDLFHIDTNYGGEMVFESGFYVTALVIIIVTVTVCVALSDSAQKYINHTEKGLELSRYMDGLKLYIEMAEADRMAMLQSVKGTDISAEGIVKLYEKLLPYAAVFGLEESWMNEMKEYCKVEEIEEPDYLMTGFAASDLSRTMHMASNYANTATTMSSSGGSSSSGFSGGGGGGFSGGGGGGGGFGGR
ncbi:DUF2207 domain-containing protein [Candidatus Saccharibacteria bacterium]|nr:DUF2207 domain-containing protein [Candidatus Saccharibacteria bacterium]